MTDISIIIPCFNEEEGIGKLLTTLSKDPYIKKCEIIVVDDGSSDQSARIIGGFKSVRLIKHVRNAGYGQAVVTGMKNSTRSNVVWMDGDGQHQLGDVIKLCKILVAPEIDFVIGERDRNSHQVKRRILGKLVLRMFIKLCGVSSISDFNSGLRGFKTNVIRKYFHLLKGGFGASTTTTLLMEMRNYNGATCSINVLSREGISSVRQVRDGMRTILLIFRSLLLFRPMQFFLTVGLAFFAVGITYGIWTTISEGIGFPVFGAVLVLAGIIVVMLGLITDQISQLRLEKFE